MNISITKQNTLTDAERTRFEQDGYLVLENVLSDDHVADLLDATDEIVTAEGLHDGYVISFGPRA